MILDLHVFGYKLKSKKVHDFDLMVVLVESPGYAQGLKKNQPEGKIHVCTLCGNSSKVCLDTLMKMTKFNLMMAIEELSEDHQSQ